MHAYVRMNYVSKNILSISSFYSSESDMKVILDEDTVDFTKIYAYFVYTGKDGQEHLKLDEDKYKNILKEQEKQEQIAKGEQLKQELQERVILNYASDEDAYTMRYLYPEWSGESVSYKKNDRFMYHDKFYKVLQKHTSQADWTPDTASSLYVEISDPAEEWPEFKQPTGAHDAYAKDAKVTFEGKHYKSLIDANVYSPTAYPQGWELVE